MSDEGRNILRAPWTPAQVEALNRWQACEFVHPYTCPNRSTADHKRYAEARRQHDHGILKARAEGWICPVCGYTQTVALEMMLHAERFDLSEILGADPFGGGRDIIPAQAHERREKT